IAPEGSAPAPSWDKRLAERWVSGKTRTSRRDQSRALPANARCGATSRRPHPRGSRLDRAMPDGGKPVPNGRLLDLPRGAEHAAGGASTRVGRDANDAVYDLRKGG